MILDPKMDFLVCKIELPFLALDPRATENLLGNLAVMGRIVDWQQTLAIVVSMMERNVNGPQC